MSDEQLRVSVATKESPRWTEAPASMTTFVILDGFEVGLTFRADDRVTLLDYLQKTLVRLREMGATPILKSGYNNKAASLPTAAPTPAVGGMPGEHEDAIDRVSGTPIKGGKWKMEFFKPGRKFADFRATWTEAELAGKLGGLIPAGLLDEHVAFEKEAVRGVVVWTRGREKDDAPGEYWQDVVRAEGRYQ